MLESMFHLHLPLLEKIVRPMIVYVCLVGFLRLFGKRELAQLNPFDLVVLMCLSNTVQNAIIGDDNTVTGGIIGVFSLLTVNWALSRALYQMPRVNEALEGKERVLIRHGTPDRDAMKRESLTEIELLSVIHKQGLNDFTEVEKCVLEPSGTFYVEAMKPTADQAHMAALTESIEALRNEVQSLRTQLVGR